MENNWEGLWAGRSVDGAVLHSGDARQIFLELKRSNGFDVVEGGIPYESLLNQYRQMKQRLSRPLPEGTGLQSVYEVGCGSGANLFLFENDGLCTGGIDYSPKLASCAKQVLRTADIRCDEASQLPESPQYDAVISVSVFGYFSGEAYAEAVLEKMCRKANYSVGILELADAEKEAEYTAHRKKLIPNYEQRYRGLPRQFYSQAFFQSFAHRHGMDIEIIPMDMEGYWNSQFYFDCYLYKRGSR